MGFDLHEEMIYSYIFHHDLQGARALLHLTVASGCALEFLVRIIVTTPSHIIVVEFGSHAGAADHIWPAKAWG